MCYSPAAITALVLNGGPVSPPSLSRTAATAVRSPHHPAPWSVPVLAVAVHARAEGAWRHVATSSATTGWAALGYIRSDERLRPC